MHLFRELCYLALYSVIITSYDTRWILKQRKTPPSVQTGNHCHLTNETKTPADMRWQSLSGIYKISTFATPADKKSRGALHLFTFGAVPEDYSSNPDKTELIWFGSWHFLQQLPPNKSTIQVCGVHVKPMNCVRNLGVLLDSELSMRIHISKVVSVGFFHLRRLRQLRKILDRNLRQRLVSALILSRIDYCNTVFAGLPASTLLPLQRLINAAARYVADLGPFDSVTGTLKELHWLPIKQRITYKLCIMMHTVVHETAPVYIRDMVVSVADLPGRERLRSASSGTFDVPRVRTHYGFTGILHHRPSSMECSSCWSSAWDIHKRCVQEES